MSSPSQTFQAESSNIVKALLQAGAKVELTTKFASESEGNEEREAAIALFKNKYQGKYVSTNAGVKKQNETKKITEMSVSTEGEVWIKNRGADMKAPIEEVLCKDGTIRYSYKFMNKNMKQIVTGTPSADYKTITWINSKS